jgi:nickel-type superoxide dismutase maturation protease
MNARSGPFKRAALALGLVAFGLFLIAVRPVLGRFRAVVVEGESMTPALLSEDYVLVDTKAYAHGLPKTGDVVLAQDPRETGRTLLKRVAWASAAGIELLGDNAAVSTDSRDFGPVSPELLRGRVVLIYWPPSRLGRVR